MSLLPLVTRANPNQTLFIPYTTNFNPSTISVSTITSDKVSANFISSSTLVSNYASISTLDAKDVNTSTIFANEVFIDNQGLTATPTELLLNGIPLATTSNISSLADWSLDPAIATVQMNNNDLNNAKIIGAVEVSSLVGTYSTLTANNIFTQNLFVQSTITTINFISTTNVVADNVYASNLTSTLALEASTFNGYTVGDFLSTSAVVANIIASTITASEFVSTPAVFVSSINGQSIGSIITGDTSNWATFKAVSQVDLSGFALFSGAGATTDLTLNGSRYLNANATGVFITADEPLNPASFTDISLTTGGGNRGRIQLTANPGLTGINGEVNIVANGGSDSGIILGGVISIQANTPLGVAPTATSAVKISGAGVNSYAGAIPSIASLAGYNFIYGTLGVNVCAGLPSILPNIPGTTYLYGSLGCTLESGFGSDVEVKDSDFACLSIRPRTSILVNYGDLELTGRINLVAPSQYITMSNVKKIDFENGTLASINNLSTLNGQPISYYSPQPIVSTFNDLNTDILNASNINMQGPGFINWQGGVSMYETGPNSFFITNGAGNTIDIFPTGFVFTEASNGTTMIFENAVLTVGNISTANIQALTGMVTSSLTVSSINGVEFPTSLVSSFDSLTTSTLTLSPSTILRGNLTGSVLEVLESAVPTNYGQVEAQAYSMAATTTSSNGTLIYQDILDKPAFINNSGVTNTLAYLANETLSVSSLGVSTIVGDFGDIQNLFTQNIASSDPLASGISGFSSIQANTIQTRSINFNTGTLSSLLYISSSVIAAGTSTATYLNTDFSVGTNDIFCGQLRVFAGSSSNAAEIAMTGPDGRFQVIDLQTGDRTLRTRLGTLANLSTGYILDTYANPPFFSTLAGTTTALMAFFPSTTSSTIGISTLSVMPQLSYYCSAYSSTTQNVIGANTPTNINHNATSVNIGGFTVANSTITVPVSGTYEIGTSIQLDKSGGGVGVCDFWFKKNGADIPNSASQTTVQGNNGEVLATVSIFETAVANDQFTVCFASPDATMSAAFFQSTVTTPYTRPAVPSIITNIKRLGA